MSNNLPVTVIGAGPVGLAAAAHLLERGETPLIFEAGPEVGANIRSWQHVRMFSPWEFTVDQASVRLLEKQGWEMPPKHELPTGYDLIENYLIPLAELPEVKKYLRLNAKVVAISRRDIDKMLDAKRENAPFILHVAYTDGREELVEARAVIDASGTWHQPNPAGSGGLPAIGEQRNSGRIAYGIPDILGAARTCYLNQRVMVLGSGHSAINALLDLVELQADYPATQLFWAMRSTNLTQVFGGGEDDALPARGKLGLRIKAAVESGTLTIVAPFRVREMQALPDGMKVIGETPDGLMTIQIDELIVSTGARPDLNMLRELRLELDPSLESTRALGPMIDPNIHSCGTVRPHGEAELRHPEKDFYIVGMKSYGRAPTFLLATGYEQVRSVVAALVGDWEAARDVQLNLPETGVCSTDSVGEGAACCGTSNTATSQASVVSLASIPVRSERLQLVSIPTAASRACGCDDTCCGDGVRSTTCGCETSCCS